MILDPRPNPRLRLVPFEYHTTSKGSHEIMPFIQCPKLYQYVRVRGIRSYSPFVVEPLSVGLLVHTARAQWLYDDRKGDLWREAMFEYQQHSPEKLAPAALSIAVQVFEAYVQYWSIRPFPQVLAVEHPFQPRVLYQGAPAWTARTARLDSIERYRGQTWIGEVKTTSSSPSRVVDIYMLHVQTLLGCALWGPTEDKRFGKLAGVLLDVMVKPTARKPPSFKKIPLSLSEMDHALKWFRRDFTTWIMQSSRIQWNDTVERRPLCMGPHGPCPARRMCLRGRRGSLGFIFADGTPIHKWTPTEGKEVPPWD